MQLWFARGSDVSLREQLVTQFVLGILSDDLAPGQRLPSTREMARRFHLHANTVSAAYRQLEKEQWVEARHGSGVYVRKTKPETQPSTGFALDQLIANLVRSARDSGIALADVRTRMRHWMELQPPDHFLLIEPDVELKTIAEMELRQAATLPIESCGIEELHTTNILDGAIPLAFPHSAARTRQHLPSGTELLTLSFRSVPSSLAGWLPAPSGALVAVASRWPKFLTLARTMLVAAGFPTEALVLRDMRESKWQRGLRQAAVVICDRATECDLPKGVRAICFSLLSEESISKLRRYQNFICDPLIPSE